MKIIVTMPSDIVKFPLGTIVYFKMNPHKCGIVTKIHFSVNGVTYTVTWDDFQDRDHFDVELTTEKNHVAP